MSMPLVPWSPHGEHPPDVTGSFCLSLQCCVEDSGAGSEPGGEECGDPLVMSGAAQAGGLASSHNHGPPGQCRAGELCMALGVPCDSAPPAPVAVEHLMYS